MLFRILCGLFILIPVLRRVSLHGNSSRRIFQICAKQILEAYFRGGCERFLRQQRNHVVPLQLLLQQGKATDLFFSEAIEMYF